MPTTAHDVTRADMFTRNRLVDELSSRRTALGYSQRGLADVVGVTRNSVMTLERRRPANPRVETLAVYGQALRLELHLDVVDLPEVACPYADLLAIGGFVGESLVARLRAIRTHMGVSRHDIAAKHGWQMQALAAFENGLGTPMLAQLQRFTRVLGGRLGARWEAFPC